MEINIEEFHDFRKKIVESTYHVFNPVQEGIARRIREKERSTGVPMNKTEFYKTMQLFKDACPKPLRVRLAYRFRAAYWKMLQARQRGEDYDFLNDRQLMLNQADVDNYIGDLKEWQSQGCSLTPFAFAREFLHDDLIPPFEELLKEVAEEHGMKLEECLKCDLD